MAGRATGSALTEPLGRVLLVTGPEEFLSERVVSAARTAVTQIDAEAEHADSTGDQVTPASFGELSAPSLFSSTRCVVVRKLEDTPEDSHQLFVDYAGAPEPDIALVLVHSGGAKGSGLLAKLRKLPAVEEHKSEAVKPRALVEFVAVEARQVGARIEPDAAQHLVDAVGADLRGLAAALDQLSHDFPEQPLTTEIVRRYFAGRAEVKSYEIADLALQGRAESALMELRWALETGVTPPAVTGSFAASVRGLARVAAAPRGLREADLAREAGVPPWKVRQLRDLARSWSPEALGGAIRSVARADADVKGAGGDAAYALERMVLEIAGARRQR